MDIIEQYVPYQYLIVAAVVLAALFILTLAFRALAGRSSGGESSRLGVSEYLEVDKQRRLVLVRRDDVEHLLLIGGGQDIVVEAVIRPGVQRREDIPAAPRVIPGDRLEAERERTPPVARPDALLRPVPIRTAPRQAVGDQPPAPVQQPEPGRAEPRLGPLTAEDKSREV